MPNAMPALEVINLVSGGPISYEVAWEMQRERVACRQKNDVPDALFLLEHPPTVTYGKTADPRFRLLTDAQYEQRGIALIATDRGGDVTYHGPGQIVGYPVLHLGEGNRDLHRYVRRLETVLIRTASELGVRGAGRANWHAGVWVEDGYLAALGVKVSRWVTHHGFALNVTEAVRAGMETIVPCGVSDKKIVTLESLLATPLSVQSVSEVVARFFLQEFST